MVVFEHESWFLFSGHCGFDSEAPTRGRYYFGRCGLLCQAVGFSVGSNAVVGAREEKETFFGGVRVADLGRLPWVHPLKSEFFQ